MTHTDEAMRIWREAVAVFDAAVDGTLHLPDDDAEKVCDEAAAAVIARHMGDGEAHPAPAPADVVERLAMTMREAYAMHEGDDVIPWEKAANGPREAWLCCARAALSVRDAERDRLREALVNCPIIGPSETAAAFRKRQDVWLHETYGPALKETRHG